MNDERKPWPFRQRWSITGRLMTMSPLHIGSGDTTTHEALNDGAGPVEIADCIRDHRGLPLIPATSLKGVLRAWLEGHGEQERIKRLFGEDANKDDSGEGGEAEFHDAPLGIARNGETPLPHWQEERQTWVEILNSIDRERAAAAEHHLVHRAVVPAGVGFSLCITGMSSDPEGDLALLLAALEGFNAMSAPITLGADGQSGKGLLRWAPTGIYRMDAAAALRWALDDARPMAALALPPLPPEERARLQKIAGDIHRDRVSACGGNQWLIGLELHFDGPFLVNDPPTEREKAVPQENRPPDARPRTDEQGRVILPAKSFRGVLRSQAERILRTLLDLDEEQWREPEIENWVRRRIACRPEIAAMACKPLKSGESPEEGLCLACQLFGAPGWRTPLRIADFRLIDRPGGYQTVTQEMLAVDRFTGGGKDHAKYNALSIVFPVLTGAIEVDKDRLPDWGLGLLALALRDLKEGDLAFGWGAAGKGYGRCTAEIGLWDDSAFRDEAGKAWESLKSALDEHKKRCPRAGKTPAEAEE